PVQAQNRHRETRQGNRRPAGGSDHGGTPVGSPAPALMTGAAAVAAEPVPVAFLGRTSTANMQDPRASLRRQLRSAQDWLPAGWFIAAVYWDIESGGIDLEARSQGDAY